MQKLKIKDFFGNRAFYRSVLAITLPIMLQNGITNFVNLLDNIMIGRVGTLQMSGVAIANQLLFVFNLCVFGALSGVGIFTAQYHGKKDAEGIKATFRVKIFVVLALAVIAFGVFWFFGDRLIGLYLLGEGTPEDAAETLGYGFEYLRIMMISFVPYVFAQVYASTLRETGNTVLPMTSGIIAVFVNLVFNYILIYGHFGAPALGVAGAAIATVLSRFVECAVVALVTHLRKEKAYFVKGLYGRIRMPEGLLKNIFTKGMPLMMNEALWSLGMTFLNQTYSLRSQDVIAAINISNTLWNLVSVTFFAFGVAVGIIVGHNLGAQEYDEARANVRKTMVLSFFIAMLVAGINIAVSSVFPLLYNTSETIRHLSSSFIIISACFMPFDAISHTAYFTMRAGGKTWITFVFDSLFVWAVYIPIALMMVNGTNFNVEVIKAVVESTTILKCIFGIFLIRKGIWLNNLVGIEKEKA